MITPSFPFLKPVHVAENTGRLFPWCDIPHIHDYLGLRMVLNSFG
jgi:hypothetical protein